MVSISLQGSEKPSFWESNLAFSLKCNIDSIDNHYMGKHHIAFIKQQSPKKMPVTWFSNLNPALLEMAPFKWTGAVMTTLRLTTLFLCAVCLSACSSAEPFVFPLAAGATAASLSMNRLASQSVLPGSDIFLRMEADKTSAYAGEQILLSYRVFTRVSARAEEFTKDDECKDFWQEDVPIDKNYVPEKVLENRRQFLSALVRKKGIFPMSAGYHVIQPGQFRASYKKPRSNDRVEMILQTEPVGISVKDLPAEGKPANFTGSVGVYTVDAHVDQDEKDLSEPVKWVVEVKGKGNIRQVTLPNLDLKPDFEILKIYEDVEISPVRDEVQGAKKFIIPLSPRKTGLLNIPSFSFSYFDLAGNRYKTLTTKSFDVQVDKIGPDVVKTLVPTSDEAMIIILFDTSESMLAEDFQPENRMKAVKGEIEKMVGQLNNTRIGIMAFQVNVLQVAALTEKRSDLLAKLESINISSGENGTAIGVAIHQAVKELNKHPSSNKKMILVVTDGANNRGYIDPVTSADLAKKENITIYSIVVGADGMVPYPVIDKKNGRKLVSAKIEVDEKTMAQISEMTHGKSFRAHNTQELKEAFGSVANIINQK